MPEYCPEPLPPTRVLNPALSEAYLVYKPTPTGHNMPLEIAWTVAPLFILAFLFHKGFVGYMDLAVAPANSIEVRVNAKQWSW